MKKSLLLKIILGVFLLALTACAPLSNAAGNVPTDVLPATPQSVVTQTTAREAQVESVEIRFTQAVPQQANAIDAVA